jgi:hypothetical protein
MAQAHTPMPLIHGQNAFVLATRAVSAAITRFGAMLAPVTFFADSGAPIMPYSIPPWATEPALSSVPPLLRALRGDFMCSAFGDNGTPYDGVVIPPHGDTANGRWMVLEKRSTALGTALRLAMDLPTQGGRCIGTTALIEGHQFVYQRHDFEGLSGAINPGHHAMLACSPALGSALLSFSPWAFAATSPQRAALTEDKARSQLVPGKFADGPAAMPTGNNVTVDLTSFPTEERADDVFLVCSKPTVALAWSAATFPARGYAWIALRRAAQLPSTLVWLSNGGRFESPWNGRHAPVLALEDIIGYFASGLAESAQHNALVARGIPTCLIATPGLPILIPYIQGLVRIPADFGRVAAVEPAGPGELLVLGAGGGRVATPCRWEFLTELCIPGLCE